MDIEKGCLWSAPARMIPLATLLPSNDDDDGEEMEARVDEEAGVTGVAGVSVPGGAILFLRGGGVDVLALAVDVNGDDFVRFNDGGPPLDGAVVAADGGVAGGLRPNKLRKKPPLLELLLLLVSACLGFIGLTILA